MGNMDKQTMSEFIKRFNKLTKKLDSVLETVIGYEGRIRVIESTQINNNFDLVNLKGMFDTEIKRRVELENKMIGLEDMVIQHYAKLFDSINEIKELFKDGKK